jgi:Tol biopolymer transport system component
MRRPICRSTPFAVASACVVAVASGFMACGQAYSASADDEAPPDAMKADAVVDERPMDVVDAGTVDAADSALGCGDPARRFVDRAPLTSLNTPRAESLPRLSPDELTVYVASDRDAGFDIYVAARSAKNVPFQPLVPLDGVNGPGLDANATLSADALFVVFDRGTLAARQLLVARRSNAFAPFDMPVPLVGASSNGSEFHPFLRADLGELWFVSTRNGAGAHLYHGELVDGGLSNVTAAPAGINSTVEEAAPVLTADGLTLYFASTRAGPDAKGGFDIYTASRTSITAPFSAPSPVLELNTASHELPGWISPDGCRLYITGGAATTEDIQVASK